MAMSKLRRLAQVLVATAVAALALQTHATFGEAQADRIADLVAQLDGPCRFRATYDRCEPRALLSLDLLFQPRTHTCVYWAATCLAQMGPEARAALPALLHALRDGPNDFDTGDGTIGTRSAVARALAAIGDPAAVPGLVHALVHAEAYDTAALTGTIRDGRPAARLALVAAIASFGPGARSAAEALAAVLEERNADREYNRDAAARITVLARRLGTPEEQPPRLYFNDQLAEAAAAALGSVGAVEAVPLLVVSLENRGAARGAADGLGRLGEAARPAAWRLRAILASPDYQADAKIAAAGALGRIGDRTVARALADGLADRFLVHGFLDALAPLGPAAEPAVPAVVRVLVSPSGAVRVGNAVHLDVAASRAKHRRLHAAETLGRIGTDSAFAALVGVLTDWEIGATACWELRRLDPGGTRIRNAVAHFTPEELARYRETRVELNPCLDPR
jgi:HEAT repeat protein